MKQRWIEIPYFALAQSPRLTQAQQELANKQISHLLAKGVPFDILKYAQGLFEKYYGSRALFNLKKKRLFKEPLNELEMEILAQCDGFQTPRGGGDFHCYYNGQELKWRLQSWNNEADPSLPYLMRYKSQLRHM